MQTNILETLKEVTGEDYDKLCPPLSEEETAKINNVLSEAYESYFQRHPEEWDEVPEIPEEAPATQL